ncbi:hypothetical protein B2D07_08460 [Desulfococcus multivorans]|nr:hypothetical protein B2D07_08460 [Desulfococcus multivorans]
MIEPSAAAPLLSMTSRGIVEDPPGCAAPTTPFRFRRVMRRHPHLFENTDNTMPGWLSCTSRVFVIMIFLNACNYQTISIDF